MAWDVGTGQEIGTLRGHSHWVFSVAFSADGAVLASGSEDRTIRLWDWRAGRESTVLTGHADCVRVLAFGPLGKLLASGGDAGQVRIWRVDG